MRISGPLGRSGIRIQGGCILTPVTLLIYLVYWTTVLAVVTVVLLAMGLYYVGYGGFLGARALYRSCSQPRDNGDPPPANQAQYSDRR